MVGVVDSRSNMGIKNSKRGTTYYRALHQASSEDIIKYAIGTTDVLGQSNIQENAEESEAVYCRNDKQKSTIYNHERYGFLLCAPFNTSNHCCYVMKKEMAHAYNRRSKRHPITAQMASESRLRTSHWLKNQCNGFDMKSPISNPMSFWFDADVLEYAALNNIKLASAYGEVVSEEEVGGQLGLDSCFKSEDLGIFDIGKKIYKTTGWKRTGCFACGFGMHLENEDNSRLATLYRYSNPKLMDWLLKGGEFRETDGLWHPKSGLGYWFILLWCNKYGKMKYWIPDATHYLKEYSTEETDHYLFPEGRPDLNDPLIYDKYPWIPPTKGTYKNGKT